MSISRLNQITESLNGLGTERNTMYTNQEIVDRLKALQSALARGVFEKTHSEHLRDKDVLLHFESMAKEYGLDKTDTFLRFIENMKTLSYTIGSLIKGMKGERCAKRALKLLSYDKNVRILYNIQLEDNEVQAEYDAIVITPYGMFVIEVKNWRTPVLIASNGLLTGSDNRSIVYDLPGRMSIKEALLKEYLQEKFPENYYNMILFPDEKSKVCDDYHKIHISCGCGISYEIKEYNTGESLMTEQQVAQIADTISANHKVQYTICGVNCEEIISDYAALMVKIEESSVDTDKNAYENAELREDTTFTANEPVTEKASNNADENLELRDDNSFTANEPVVVPWYKRVNWGEVAINLVSNVVLPGVIAAVKFRKR